ncbi:MAG: hypothetical protein V5A87_08110, partial [Candidatus Bipolaricaulota bacterium]
MRYKAILISILIVTLLTVTCAAASHELYVTNQGTYVKGKRESFNNARFHPGAYYLKAGKMLYHLERQNWKFPRNTDFNAKLKRRLSVIAQDLMVERVEIWDPDKCGYALRSLETLYSGKERMKEWVESQSSAVYRPNYQGEIRELFNHTEIHPTFLDGELVSVLRVYDKYTGGAHGINNYEFHTYLLNGKELEVKDLFEDWERVKNALKLSLLEEWVTRKKNFAEEMHREDKENLEMRLLEVTDMGAELVEVLESDLASKGFIFTISEQGVRLNLYFSRYTLGPNPMGGSWISVPVKEMPEIVKSELSDWVPENQLIRRLPEELRYFSQKTQLKGIFPKPEGFNEEFVIGFQKLEDNLGCLGKLWDII